MPLLYSHPLFPQVNIASAQERNLTGNGPSEIRIDDMLQDFITSFFKVNRAPRNMVKQEAVLTLLSALELDGDAVAYKGRDGILAWKASKRLLREWLAFADGYDAGRKSDRLNAT
jgi:hypothetical protein